MKSMSSASYVAVNMTLLAFAADRRAAVDVDRKAAAPAADALCSNRSIWHARGAHSSKLAAHSAAWTDKRTPYRYIDPTGYYASNVNITCRAPQIWFE